MQCDGCNRNLSRRAPVWRGWKRRWRKPPPMNPMQGRPWYCYVATLCRDCKDSAWAGDGYFAARGRTIYWLKPAHCPGCGREVINASNIPRLKYAACSRTCRLRIYAKQRKRPRRTVERNEKQCARCGREFTPQRSDGRYCGGRCRVAAWRKARVPRHFQTTA